MKQTRINPQHVTHIKITPQRESPYVWCDKIEKETTLFGLITVVEPYDEGYWEDGCQGYWQSKLDEDRSDFTIIEDTVYWLPSISVFCGETKVYSAHYDTIAEIRELCEKEFKNVSIIL